MKKIKAEDAVNMNPVLPGRTSLVRAALLDLALGEVLIITRQDWKSKNPPYKVINRVAKQTGRRFNKGRTPDGTAWMVKRLS